jgi:hypothetical protein
MRPTSGASASEKGRKGTLYRPSFVLQDGALGEMVYDGRQTRFIIFQQGTWDEQPSFLLEPGRTLRPYSPENTLVKHRVVLFPSEVMVYRDEQTLLTDVQTFIHRYVDVSPLFERLCSYYVLFTWIYEDFNELPYLRVIGDAGSGKTRFLLTVGSLCYKSIFASGASTVSPIFRVLDIFKGTLLIDEGDFPQSDEKAEIVKILNNGNAKGFPVLRSEPAGSKGKEYSPRAYQVYGPKIIATRSLFMDRALESRCLTEEMGHRRLRDDIPINLPSSFREEATVLRNQLLLFRFRHKGQQTANPHLVDRSIEPRLNQVFVPLLSIIPDEQTRSDLKQVAHAYHRQLVSDRGMGMEAQILEVLAAHLGDTNLPSIKDLAYYLAEQYGADYEHKITPKWVGSVLRCKLHLRTERRRDGQYVIARGERPKVLHLLVRYGLSDSPVSDHAITSEAPENRKAAQRDELDELDELPTGYEQEAKNVSLPS